MIIDMTLEEIHINQQDINNNHLNNFLYYKILNSNACKLLFRVRIFNTQATQSIDHDSL